MIKRDEVVALAELANDPTISSMRLMLVNPETVRELARTWLRVNEAPAVCVTRVHDCVEGREMGEITQSLPVSLAGQRVRLVPEADSGGDRG